MSTRATPRAATPQHPINRQSATGPTEDQGSTTPKTAPRTRVTEEEVVGLEKELMEAKSTIEEKERAIKAQAERIAQLEDALKKTHTGFEHYKFLYEDLAATITYPPLVLAALEWLKTALLVEPLEDLSIETTDAGRVIKMTDQAFESMVKNFGSLTYIRYALRKQELKKEGQELYTLVKGTVGTASEVKQFVRDIRIGEMLIKLTVALKNNFGSLELGNCLKEGKLPIDTIDELLECPYWVITKFASRTVDGRCSQEMLTSPGVPSQLLKIIKDIKARKNKRTRDSASNNKNKSKK